MKKVILALLVTVTGATASFAEDVNSYATTGIWEIGGTVDRYGQRNFYKETENTLSSMIMFSFAPRVDYFIMNGFHVGLAPRMSSFLQISTILMMPLRMCLLFPWHPPDTVLNWRTDFFLDVAGEYGFGVTISDNYYRDTEDLLMKFGLALTLKIPVGNALFNIGFKQQYNYASWDNPDRADNYSAGLSLGLSHIFEQRPGLFSCFLIAHPKRKQVKRPSDKMTCVP